MKKIYISGAGGMLGDAIYNQFKHDYILSCSDKHITSEWLSFLDFRNTEEYKNRVQTFNPDYLFHIGALTDLEYCEKNEKDCFLSNFESVKNAVNISNELKIPLVFISTAGVFHGEKNVFSDEDLPNPTSNYSFSKYYSENFIQQYSHKFLIVRAGWMFGGYEKDKKFIFKIIKQIKSGFNDIYAVNDKFGTPTYTVDFSYNLYQLIQNDIYGLFNMSCPPENISRFTVAKFIVDFLDIKNINIHSVSSEQFSKEYFVQRPFSEQMLSQKLIDLNLYFMRDWKDSLADYLKKINL